MYPYPNNLPPPPPPPRDSSPDPFVEMGGELLFWGAVIWFIIWACRRLYAKFGFVIDAVLYPPAATGMHQFFGYMGAFWLYLALPLTLLACLGRRAAAREITQHRLRTAFWFCLPFLLWFALLFAYGVKYRLFVSGFDMEDIIGDYAPKWSIAFAIWCSLSTLWLVGSLLGLVFIRRLPRFSEFLNFGFWLLGVLLTAAAWAVAGWITTPP